MEQHEIRMENRKKITVTEVTAVVGFDEDTILVNLADQGMIITGENLHVEVLDLEEGKLVAEGSIDALHYTKKKSERKFLERFRRFRK